MLKNLEVGVKLFMFLRFVQVFVNHQLGDMSHHKKIFVTPSLTKKVFANMKREEKGFSRIITHLFETMMVQAPEEVVKGLKVPIDTHHTPIVTQPSSSQPQIKQKSRRSQRKETKVLDLEKAKTTQAKEIGDLKKRVKKLERKKKSRTLGLKRLWKIGSTTRVESSEDKESLGDQEDASKQGMMIDNIDQDEEIALVDESQGRINEEEMFRVNDLDGDQAKDKGKGIMVEPEKPLKKKDQIAFDEKVKIIKEGKISSYHLIRADGSTKRYSSMIQMLQHIDREDLETLWKLVKAKYGNTRPEEGYERMLWGDLKMMFEPHIQSEVWKKLQGNKVTIWKLFSSCGVHFVRF
nr:hypothetical protein [Tanacetum cinerariifolium]